MEKINIEVIFSGKDEQSGLDVNLEGILGPWQLTIGGSNKLLRLKIPFKSGYMKSLKAVDLTGIQVEVEANLSWAGNGDPALEGSGDQTQLVFHVTDTTDPSNPGYVVVNEIHDDGKLDTINKGLLREIFRNILLKNRGKLRFILADINPTPKITASWLAPKRWDYFYTQDGNIGAFCFLCMLTDDPLPEIPSFDAHIFKRDPNSNAFLAVANHVLLNNVVLPSIKKTFGENFYATADDMGWKVVNYRYFTANNIEVHDFTARLTPNGLSVNSSGGGPVRFLFNLADLPDASYSWDSESTNLFYYDANRKSIGFQKDSNPVRHSSADVPWYDWPLLIVAGFGCLPLLIAEIITFVNDYNANFDMANDAINNSLSNATGGSIVNLSEIVDWNHGGQNFNPTGSGLEGAMYITGIFSIN